MAEKRFYSVHCTRSEVVSATFHVLAEDRHEALAYFEAQMQSNDEDRAYVEKRLATAGEDRTFDYDPCHDEDEDDIRGFDEEAACEPMFVMPSQQADDPHD